MLVNSLENSYSQLKEFPFPDKDKEFNIMVLGAGHSDDTSMTATGRLSLRALGRIAEGLRLSFQIDNSKIIVSGYEGKLSQSQAQVAFQSLTSLNLEAERIIKLESPHNTLTEAKAYANMFDKGNPLILVTDAVHMRRAIFLFQKQGLSPVPAPCNFIIKKGTGKRSLLIPSATNIRKTEIALHEYAGLVAAWFETRNLKVLETETSYDEKPE
jgi:uncharacterized SAM-binding protein YcdF (DUF218 family)